MSRKVYWMGSAPTKCQITGVDIINQFVDGQSRARGPWAIMHPDYFRIMGYTPAQGIGQLYEKQEDGRWLKIAG